MELSFSLLLFGEEEEEDDDDEEDVVEASPFRLDGVLDE